jgi:hypothetical protein
MPKRLSDMTGYVLKRHAERDATLLDQERNRIDKRAELRRIMGEDHDRIASTCPGQSRVGPGSFALHCLLS